MRVADGQADFSGGMDSRTHPLFLGANQYAMGRNLEIRDHTARTRRGSWRAWEWPDSLAVQGAGMFRAPFEDQRSETIVTVRNGEVWEQHPPQPPFKMTLPTGVTIATTETPQFVQAYNVLYMLRGDNLPVLKWNGYDNSAWEVIADPVSGDKFPNSRFGIYAYNRGWVVNGTDTIDVSDLLSEAFDFAFHSYDIDSGDGGKLTALAPFVDASIVAFKENSIHLIYGCNGDLTDISRDIIDDRNGCVGVNAWCNVGKDLWFLSKDGIRTITLTTQNQAQLIDTTLSYNVQSLIDRINWNYAHKAQCTVFDNYFLCAVPWETSSVCNTILVYDLLLKTWVGYWDGITVERFLLGGKESKELYVIEQYGHVSMLLNSGYRDGIPLTNTRLYMNGAYVTFDPNMDFSIGDRRIGLTLSKAIIGYPALSIFSITAYGYVFPDPGTTGYTFTFKMNNSFFIFKLTDTLTGDYWQYSYYNPFPVQSYSSENRILLTHDGTALSLSINGLVITPPTPSGTLPLTTWINSYPQPVREIKILGTYGCTSGYCSYSDFFISFYGSRLFFVPMKEGSGLTLSDIVMGVVGTFTGTPVWVNSTESEIPTEITTRAFSFGGDEAKKTLLQGTIAIDHQNPTYTVEIIPDTPFRESTVITAKTYSTTLFSTQGKTAWDGTGPRFDEPNRENYAPLTIGTGTPSVSGISLETAGSVSYNVQLDRDQQHREKFFVGIPVQHAQAKITNTTGILGLNSIALIADQKNSMSVTKG